MDVHFILEMDQKPLEAILSRSLNHATPWLQCILIRTLPYNFTVRYIPGPKNLLADCLSQLGNQKDTIKLPKLHVYQISQQLPARSDSLQEIWQATQADDELALLKHMIMMGWPNSIKEIPQVIHPYWMFCKELIIEDGLILKGSRIVIPNKKCEAILKQIHDSHLGLTKCKLHAKQVVYWPGLNDQLEQLVLNCQLCSEIFEIQKETRYILCIRPRSSNISLDKSSNWSIPLRGKFIPPTCRLHKLIPCHEKTSIIDCSPHNQSHQANICWIWVAWHISIWQQTMLCQWNFQRADGRVSS